MIIKNRQCSRCKESKRSRDFNRSKTLAGGYQLYCRVCQKRYSKEHKRRFPPNQNFEAQAKHMTLEHLQDCYAQAVGLDARLRFRREIQKVEANGGAI